MRIMIGCLHRLLKVTCQGDRYRFQGTSLTNSACVNYLICAAPEVKCSVAQVLATLWHGAALPLPSTTHGAR